MQSLVLMIWLQGKDKRRSSQPISSCNRESNNFQLHPLFQTVCIQAGLLYARQIIQDIPARHLVFITVKYLMVKIQSC